MTRAICLMLFHASYGGVYSAAYGLGIRGYYYGHMAMDGLCNSTDYVEKHGLAADRMKHFRQLRLHPGAFARCKDDGCPALVFFRQDTQRKSLSPPTYSRGQIGRYLLANHCTFGDAHFMLRRGTMPVKFGGTYGRRAQQRGRSKRIHARPCYNYHLPGEVAEWLKAPLSKSGNSYGVRGFESRPLRHADHVYRWRGAGVAEQARLESACPE